MSRVWCTPSKESDGSVWCLCIFGGEMASSRVASAATSPYKLVHFPGSFHQASCRHVDHARGNKESHLQPCLKVYCDTFFSQVWWSFIPEDLQTLTKVLSFIFHLSITDNWNKEEVSSAPKLGIWTQGTLLRMYRRLRFNLWQSLH